VFNGNKFIFWFARKRNFVSGGYEIKDQRLQFIIISQNSSITEINMVDKQYFGKKCVLVGAGLLHQPPNLEDQVIFDQGFLPLALDTPVSNCKAAELVLIRPGYFISPVPAICGEHSTIRHRGRSPIED